MSDRDRARLVLVALDPALVAARISLLDAHPLLGDEPLLAHPEARDNDPEAVADEILFALDHLRDALRRYRRLTRAR